MNGDTKSKWVSKALTVVFLAGVLGMFVGLVTQGGGLAFADLAQ